MIPFEHKEETLQERRKKYLENVVGKNIRENGTKNGLKSLEKMVTRKSERTSSKNKNNLHTKPRFEDKRNGLLLLYTKAASISKKAAIKKNSQHLHRLHYYSTP